MFKKKSFSASGLVLILILLASLGLTVRKASAVGETPSSYNPEIANKLVTRCDLIKDYLSKTVRIDELSTRQNKVRGWEYILRRLKDIEDDYGKFSVDYSELSVTLATLRQQLEQFKVDFEAYDSEFQRLLSLDCKTNPETFWRQLETLRSFRAGISVASDSYKSSITEVISREAAKW